MIPAELKQLAQELAAASAEVIRGYYRSGLAIDDKSDASPVTQADREAEIVMRKLINERRPQDGIIGEEFGRENAEAEWVWVLDPVDGTKAFITGRPLFVTLIGLLHHGVPVLGVINQPVTGDCWLGVVGEGTTLNGKPAQVSQIADLARARIGSTGPQYFQPQGLAAFNELAAQCRFAVWGGDGYQFGLLASGGMDIAVESGIKLHDFAALAPVVIGAGGLMTDWQGKALDINSGGDVVAAATPALHTAALDCLNRG
ncbi:histidinol-phosphatase, inositol monophosphatase family [Formivibrio citricus]|uniref:Histidinol-phosphatase n=1 Tax=Formivibrio citricus TaxID=83765 RepID=A0A1I4V2L9_9NEIS|nr:histidinol-phosphatase [Formivibrio citricus]SFM95373.1 histidinol-phosphatase, inositol monophosphatase family [Formivibrio citricus]